MADLEQPASTSAPRKKSLKPTFATQASALMKKNLTYQKRNWCVSGQVERCVGEVSVGAFIEISYF